MDELFDELQDYLPNIDWDDISGEGLKDEDLFSLTLDRIRAANLSKEKTEEILMFALVAAGFLRYESMVFRFLTNKLKQEALHKIQELHDVQTNLLDDHAVTLETAKIALLRFIKLSRHVQEAKTNKTEASRKGAAIKHSRTNEFKAKAFVIWQEWQDKPHMFESKAQFDEYIQSLENDPEDPSRPLIKDIGNIQKWRIVWQKKYLSA